MLAEPGDVLLYLWDARWLNDDPTRRDPLLAAIPPGKVGDWLPRERPWPGFGHRLGEAEVYFVNSTSMRGGEQEAALRAALLRFLAEGRTTHAVLVPDPAQPPSDPRALLAAVSEAGGSWSSRWVDRVEVVVVRPISP